MKTSCSRQGNSMYSTLDYESILLLKLQSVSHSYCTKYQEGMAGKVEELETKGSAQKSLGLKL